MEQQTYKYDPMPTFWQPVNRETFTQAFWQVDGGPKTLSAPAVLDSYIVNLSAGHGFVANEILFLTQDGNIYQGVVLSVNVNELTLDSPLNYAYSNVGQVEGNPTIVFKIKTNLNTNGSVTPQKFELSAPGEHIWAVTRVFIAMILDGQPDDGTFGDIAGGLTRGCVLRVVNGKIFNKGNFKTNGDIAEVCYDLTYTTRTGPQGNYGLRARATFASQDKAGNAIILDGSNDEKVELIVQDNLTTINSFQIIGQGTVLK